MAYFVAKPDDDFLDAVSDNISNRPQFSDRFDAIKELRDQNSQGLSISAAEAARANGFFRVASLVGPLESLMHLLNPDWMKEKRGFYNWMDKHKKYVTYDRRKDAVSDRLTMSDGKVIQ